MAASPAAGAPRSGSVSGRAVLPLVRRLCCMLQKDGRNCRRGLLEQARQTRVALQPELAAPLGTGADGRRGARLCRPRNGSSLVVSRVEFYCFYF